MPVVSPPPRLLICGFGPFPGVPDNPSARVVERLQAERWAPQGWACAWALIPTTWGGAWPALMQSVRATRPDAVLAIGVAGSAEQLRVETQAHNHVGEGCPDAAGEALAGAISAGGPASLTADLPAQAMAAAIAAQNLPVEVSRDAGDYLCNYVFYRLLAEVAPAGVVSAFLHIPPVGAAGHALDHLEGGVKAAAGALARAPLPLEAALR